MRALTLVLAASCAWVAACAQETPGGLLEGAGGSGAGTSTTSTSSTPTTGSEDARTYFEANVRPILEQSCAGCHSSASADETGGPDFLGGSAAEYYDRLTAEPRYVSSDPGSSLLLTRGLHTGPALDPATQYPVVERWLELEAPARSGGGGFEGPTGEELLDKLSACMTLDDWIAKGMATVALQPTLTGTPCHACHQSGTGANYMTNDSTPSSIQDGFDRERPRPFLLNLVSYEIVSTPTGGQKAQLVQSHRWRDKGISGGLHPKYVFVDQQPKLDAWFDAVIGGQCFNTP
ncbi:MAG: hypothetical protein IT372_34605 [Polyangiaceae bacterium]|nr:hypothetical protein [Polyangiaceae bacterium]